MISSIFIPTVKQGSMHVYKLFVFYSLVLMKRHLLHRNEIYPSSDLRVKQVFWSMISVFLSRNSSHLERRLLCCIWKCLWQCPLLQVTRYKPVLRENMRGAQHIGSNPREFPLSCLLAANTYSSISGLCFLKERKNPGNSEKVKRLWKTTIWETSHLSGRKGLMLAFCPLILLRIIAFAWNSVSWCLLHC